MRNPLQQLWFGGGPLRFNMGLIVHVLSAVAVVMGLAMMVPMALSMAQQDGATWVFAAPGIPVLVIGATCLVLSRIPTSRPPLVRPRDVYLAVSSAWVFACILATVPFLLNQNFGTVPEAVFEAVSGITTTGATVFDNVDDLRDSIKLWRSLLQWMGGIGIVVLFVGIAPALGSGAMNVFFAEVGLARERLTPRISQTAKLLVKVYLGLSVAAFVAYRLAGMGTFDAINHMMTSVATGGFSTRTESIAAFDSLAITLVAMVFMLVGGVNFAVFWNVARRNRPSRLQLAELTAYLGIAAVVSLLAAVTLMAFGDVADWGTALLQASFSVVSVMTTTGYTIADFDAWNELARGMILFLMFVGGCAGSTAGGIKIVRWMLLTTQLRQETNKLLHPKAVTVFQLAGRSFPERVRTGLLVFLTFYMTTFALVAIALTAMGVQLDTAIAASAATLNMVGPGLFEVGASESYQAIPPLGMLLLSLNMLLGRLEIFTVLVLFLPGFWRRR